MRDKAPSAESVGRRVGSAPDVGDGSTAVIVIATVGEAGGASDVV